MYSAVQLTIYYILRAEFCLGAAQNTFINSKTRFLNCLEKKTNDARNTLVTVYKTKIATELSKLATMAECEELSIVREFEEWISKTPGEHIFLLEV